MRNFISLFNAVITDVVILILFCVFLFVVLSVVSLAFIATASGMMLSVFCAVIALFLCLVAFDEIRDNYKSMNK